MTWTPGGDATRYFQLGTMANGVAAALRVSLPYIRQLGVENIQAWRQPMLKKLQAEMPRLGFQGSNTPGQHLADRDVRAPGRRHDPEKAAEGGSRE